MGLWLKNEDGFVPVSGGSGGSGDGGPHDHAEYALVEHDHDDYLPLTGGTLTGDLQVDSTITVAKAGNQALVTSDYFRAYAGSGTTPAFSFAGAPHLGMYLSDSVGTGMIGLTGSLHVSGTTYVTLADGTRAAGDLTVDDVLTVGNTFNTAWANVTNNLAVGALLTVNGDLQVGSTITVAKAGNQAVVNSDYFRAYAGSITTPAFSFAAAPHLGMYLADAGAGSMIGVSGSLHVSGTIYGTMAFGITEGIDAADVLDRAETATMPVLDDDGVATADADVESVTVNEVVTALLAKVKELSARIEELEGN